MVKVVVVVSKVTGLHIDKATKPPPRPRQPENSRGPDQHPQVMSMLPFELYKLIVDELESRRDFLVLARTSKAFRSEIISKLYDTVTLEDEISTILFLLTYQTSKFSTNCPLTTQLGSPNGHLYKNYQVAFRG
jgi:hypothetical protein